MTTLNDVGARRRSHPMVWVKQIVLYKSIKPVEEIRTVSLTVGLNIVQGESNDSTEVFESGHGNGKTTLCRLIRYCLGEESFGQQHVVKEVKHCFPTGYVGAVIEVSGEAWSVLRSLGHRGKDVAMRGVNLAGLLNADDARTYAEFKTRLDEVSLAALQRRDVLSGGHSIQWLHLLALCSRDQESRYDRFWHWRDPRSDSGNSKLFTKPKLDAALCVRSILGLLDPNEPGCRKRLDEINAELEALHDKIKEKAAEPRFHITRIRTLLSEELAVSEASDAPLEQGHIFGISQATDAQLSKLRDELAEIEEQKAPLDRQINLATLQYREVLELQEQQEAGSEVTNEGSAVLMSELDKLQSQRLSITERGAKLCPTGDSLVSNCAMVKARLANIEQLIADERKSTLPLVAQRDREATSLTDQAKRKNDLLLQRRVYLDELNRQRNELFDRSRVINDHLKRIPLTTVELLKWHRIVSAEIPNDDLTNLQSDETTLLKEMASLKSQLTDVLATQNNRAKAFGKRFNEIVKQTITSDFKGAIIIDDEGISFRISRERSLGGEAYETLAVLLADIAILMESATASTCHPGILIHDSPREADLYIRLYERMLDMAHSFMSGENRDVPYQYIVTTTTRPSEQLRASSITKETLSSGPGSLFKQQLEAPGSDQKTLFDEAEET